MAKRIVKPIPLRILRTQYNIEGLVENWFFRVDEISNNVYRAEGADLWGRKVEYTGLDPDELLESCAQYAREVNVKSQRKM